MCVSPSVDKYGTDAKIEADNGSSSFTQCSLINLHNSNFVDDCSVSAN